MKKKLVFIGAPLIITAGILGITLTGGDNGTSSGTTKEPVAFSSNSERSQDSSPGANGTGGQSGTDGNNPTGSGNTGHPSPNGTPQTDPYKPLIANDNPPYSQNQPPQTNPPIIIETPTPTPTPNNQTPTYNIVYLRSIKTFYLTNGDTVWKIDCQRYKIEYPSGIKTFLDSYTTDTLVQYPTNASCMYPTSGHYNVQPADYEVTV